MVSTQYLLKYIDAKGERKEERKKEK